jgi:hypothetical protein
MRRKILLTGLLLSYMLPALTQKLPVRQETGVYASSTVKVDGKATEWRNKFEAYNPATELAYTMANDNNNLYFICSATEVEVIQKILVGGITLAMSPVDKKASVTPIAITYPIVPWSHVQVNHLLRPSGPLSDSTLSLVNNRISGHLKEIKVTGVKDFPDGSVSVYNDRGIKAAHYIGNNKVYTCEIAFPLSYSRQLINGQGTFNYKLQVNGMDMKTTIVAAGTDGSGGSAPSDQAVPHGALYNTSPTYFNATYTLAKK